MAELNGASACSDAGKVARSDGCRPRVRRYLAEEAERFGTTVERILSDLRGNQEEISARRTVMRRLRADGSTTGQIARWLGRDISTVRFHIDQRFRRDKMAKMDARYAGLRG